MSAVAGRTIALVRAGYDGKRLQYERMAELGVRIVLLDEPGHWSESLVETGLAERWIPIAVTGRSSSRIRSRPDVKTSCTGGQRLRMACASLRPSMLPGILMSVNTT